MGEASKKFGEIKVKDAIAVIGCIFFTIGFLGLLLVAVC